MALIVGLIRARNEERWIGRALASLRTACDHLILMDDASTDRTAEIARAAGAEVIPSTRAGDDWSESRDKEALLRHLDALRPDGCIMIDGDEQLLGGVRVRALLLGGASRIALQVLYLWDRLDQVRYDGLYSRFWRPSAWRWRPGEHWAAGTGRHGLHVANAPPGAMAMRADGAAILHYGYLERETRLRKYGFYNSIDRGNEFEDDYRHIIAGDPGGPPADEPTRWAGPLRLVPLSDVIRQLGVIDA